MKCIDKECEYRELNGGDEISDFYYCKYCGITVKRGQKECLIDEFEKENSTDWILDLLAKEGSANEFYW